MHTNKTQLYVSTTRLQRYMKPSSLRHAISHHVVKYIPEKYITDIDTQLCIKIKSHQLRSNGYPKFHVHPQPCMDLIRSNPWADKRCKLPYIYQIPHPFPLRCNTTIILSPLFFHPMNMYYGIYPVDTDMSDFTTVTYYAEIILRLVSQPEMGWYARNMLKSHPPNRTIGFTGPTRRLITHQAISLTQHLYKDKYTQTEVQQIHHP